MYHKISPGQAVSLEKIGKAIGAPPPEGHAAMTVRRIDTLETADGECLSVLSNDAYADKAKSTKAAVVLVSEDQKGLLPETTVAWVVPHPYAAFAHALALLYPDLPVQGGIAGTASVSSSAQVDPTARVEPGAVIYAGATLAAGVHIGANTVIGPGVSIGARSRIGPHGSVFKAVVGEDCLFHPGVRIGQDGFGFALEDTVLVKVPQVGGVRIGNRVELGANVTIDCGALGDTVLEDDVKLDNQVQIAHGARIGASTRIVAQSAVAGSATLGAFNLIGGQSGVVGHITTAPGLALAARSGLTKSVTDKGAIMAGVPAVPIAQWRRTVAALARLVKKDGPTNSLVIKDAADALEKRSKAKPRKEADKPAVLELDEDMSPF